MEDDNMKTLNQKLKSLFKKAFDTKLGKWFLRSLALINTVEGVIHLVVAVIGIWGVCATGVVDPRLLLPIVENIILGGASLITGWALGHEHHHHH